MTDRKRRIRKFTNLISLGDVSSGGRNHLDIETMQTNPVAQSDIARSVIAVPPLARKPDLSINREENRKLIQYIENGGVSTLLYGGNANFYHLSLSEYEQTLELLVSACAEDTLVIPSVGPAFGTMMDQAKILSRFAFPTAMMLPMNGLTTDDGVASGFRKFVDEFGKPAVLYLKFEGFLEPDTVAKLVDEGLVSWIKYAIVRKDPSRDDYLAKLVDSVDPALIVSGIGEQPAIVHLDYFGVGGFTSGCVCVAPRLSQSMLKAIKSGEMEKANLIRQTFRPLENLRNEINPIRVLHEAVRLAGIADTGSALPLLSNLDPVQCNAVQLVAKALAESG